MTLTHHGMSREFFDRAFHRAMLCELTIQPTNRPGTVAIGSSTDDEVVYLVTDQTCSCAGHARVGRCFHRALYLGWSQILRHVEPSSARFGDDRPRPAA